MLREVQLTLNPEQASSLETIKKVALQKIGIESFGDFSVRIVRKSVDARGRFPKINLTALVSNKDFETTYSNTFDYKNVSNAPEVLIVGAGPAGLFAALRLIKLGLKPIILERGKEVAERKKDIAQLNRNLSINEDSNYCFGEGGAGTFSDGKLFTRSKKRGDIRRILETFHIHGAQDEILYEAHPHIGTDKLPIVIKNIRKTILDCGGEVHFGSKLSNLILQGNKVVGAKTADGNSFSAKAIILSTGHSARDVYELLQQQNILIESKGFAMGVRVEHPQELIDQIQYHSKKKDPFLPAATYNLVQQVDGRGVYSFCMCPGGHIVPASTAKDELVVNGMSSSKRNSPFANSGIVVEIRPEDLPDYNKNNLCGLEFQKTIERLALANNGGGLQTAPAQRLADFAKGRLSADLPQCSYLPGVISSPLSFWLPESIGKRLQQGFKAFDKKMHGFLTNEALIVAVESRSSSPIRIPRDKETGEHLQISGLFPCGEGSGYAGGITSSAMDGEWIAEKVKNFLSEK